MSAERRRCSGARQRRGYLPAILRLAAFYVSPGEIEPDMREAANWYRRAAELGDRQAQCVIAELLCDGSAGGVNLPEAARWFRAAADQGHPAAAYHLAGLCQLGLGIARDGEQAARWYLAAAQRGLREAFVKVADFCDDRTRRRRRGQSRQVAAEGGRQRRPMRKIATGREIADGRGVCGRFGRSRALPARCPRGRTSRSLALARPSLLRAVWRRGRPDQSNGVLRQGCRERRSRSAISAWLSPP